MLIPCGIFACLRGPLARLVGHFQIVGQQTAAGRAGDDLVAVIGDGSIVTEAAALFSFPSCAHSLCCVLNKQSAVCIADLADLTDVAGEAVQLCTDHKLDLRVHLKGLFQRHRIHVPRRSLGIDEHRDAALVDHRIQGSVEGHIRAEHPLAFQCTMADHGLAVQLFTGKLHAQMQRCGAAAQCHSILHAGALCCDFFHLIDILTHRAHPVGLVGFRDIFQFLTVHGRRCQPHLICKRCKITLTIECHNSSTSFLFRP